LLQFFLLDWLLALFKNKGIFMTNPKVMMQASSFLTRMNIPYSSIKMFGKLLMINTTDIQSANLIASILNSSGAANVSVDEPEDRYQEDYAVVGLMNDEIEYGEETDDE
jgi:hypothetical protein